MSQSHWLFAKKTRFIPIQKLTSAFYEKYVSSNSVHNKLYAESICCSLYAEPVAQAHNQLQITVHIKGSNLNIACQRGNLWYVNWFLHLYFVRRNSPNMINIFFYYYFVIQYLVGQKYIFPEIPTNVVICFCFV